MGRDNDVFHIQGKEKKHSAALLKRCLGFFLPYKLRIITSACAMSAAGLCDAGTAWLVKPALDEIFINKNSSALLLIPPAFLGITALKASLKLLQNYLMQYTGLRVLERLRGEIYSKIIFLPLRFYEETSTGVLISRIMNDVSSICAGMPAVVTAVRQFITMTGLLFVIFYQDAALALRAVLFLPLAFLPFLYFGRRMRRLSRRGQAQTGDISAVLHEILSGIRVVKSFGMEQRERTRFDKENKRLLRTSLKSALAGDLSSSTMELVGGIGIGVIIWIGAVQVIDGTATPGTFFSFVAALIMLYQPIKQLSESNLAVQGALAGAERVFGLLDDADLTIEKGGKLAADGEFRELCFDHVSFAYPDGTQALRDITFTLRAGERLALVGPSGAGKSTLVALVPRFYAPQAGRILFNGRLLEDYYTPSLRSRIAVVSQDAFLFNMSIRENILYSLPDADEETCRSAAEAAYADEFIENLPQGYGTVTGERGVKLSGGQKQRLTIARAIAKNAPLLILDEATSALDSRSERVVQKALDNLMRGRTSIVIAHRLSTILSADRILVLDGGRITGQGSHAELLLSCTLYAKLYEMQFNSGDGNDGTAASAGVSGLRSAHP
ncbi:MAG: ABC transporter ATP-binding protein/permease [Desulfovibrio sp.]|jgi:subfamily B ATP-binding cassette protein MsbA|nr:ABC transporter ATP-binding protein/permease [Desulfovibrio sp.]